MACIKPPHVVTPPAPRSRSPLAFTLGSAAVDGEMFGRIVTSEHFAVEKQAAVRAMAEIKRATSDIEVARALLAGLKVLQRAMARAGSPSDRQSLRDRKERLQKEAIKRKLHLVRPFTSVVAGNLTQKNNTVDSGLVVFWTSTKSGSKLTIEAMEQFSAHINVSNQALAAGHLSSVGRVSTSGKLRYDSNGHVRRERARAKRAGTPYSGHVGHVPDSTWVGRPEPYEWHDQLPFVNQSLGRQSKDYPLGFKPTGFALGYKWNEE